ncbi:hypothetical protein AtubIFM57258_004394 [Aspergillus tubingensis]|nr:hypothetical protein AtubIFM57258_004394 [Aspergillus tubingensis]
MTELLEACYTGWESGLEPFGACDEMGKYITNYLNLDLPPQKDTGSNKVPVTATSTPDRDPVDHPNNENQVRIDWEKDKVAPPYRGIQDASIIHEVQHAVLQAQRYVRICSAQGRYARILRKSWSILVHDVPADWFTSQALSSGIAARQIMLQNPQVPNACVSYVNWLTGNTLPLPLKSSLIPVDSKNPPVTSPQQTAGIQATLRSPLGTLYQQTMNKPQALDPIKYPPGSEYPFEDDYPSEPEHSETESEPCIYNWDPAQQSSASDAEPTAEPSSRTPRQQEQTN